MKSPAKSKRHGIVAILDALGAATYTDEEIQRFIKSRENVLQLLREKIEGALDESNWDQIKIFTFNDTILIAFDTQQPAELRQVEAFLYILRKFLVDSLAHKILFRGSVAIGTFYVDDGSNTVMGQAITDAAGWYDASDWIGLITTPKTSITIQRLLIREDSTKEHLMLDYDVPLKGGSTLSVKVVNWPKVFFIKRISPCLADEQPKEKFLELISSHPVPTGTEKKYFNTIKFFEYASEVIQKRKSGKVILKQR